MDLARDPTSDHQTQITEKENLTDLRSPDRKSQYDSGTNNEKIKNLSTALRLEKWRQSANPIDSRMEAVVQRTDAPPARRGAGLLWGKRKRATGFYMPLKVSNRERESERVRATFAFPFFLAHHGKLCGVSDTQKKNTITEAPTHLPFKWHLRVRLLPPMTRRVSKMVLIISR